MSDASPNQGQRPRHRTARPDTFGSALFIRHVAHFGAPPPALPLARAPHRVGGTWDVGRRSGGRVYGIRHRDRAPSHRHGGAARRVFRRVPRGAAARRARAAPDATPRPRVAASRRSRFGRVSSLGSRDVLGTHHICTVGALARGRAARSVSRRGGARGRGRRGESYYVYICVFETGVRRAHRMSWRRLQRWRWRGGGTPGPYTGAGAPRWVLRAGMSACPAFRCRHFAPHHLPSGRATALSQLTPLLHKRIQVRPFAEGTNRIEQEQAKREGTNYQRRDADCAHHWIILLLLRWHPQVCPRRWR